jgi:hypothetical protein
MQEYIVKVYNDGEVCWFNEKGQIHREDGPAREYLNGPKEWYKNGQLHRKDGPAVEYPDGYKVWYKNEKLHREDGPAVEWANDFKAWYLNGKEVTEQEVMGHTIVIDGKEVKISAESYKKLKENL